MHVPDHLLFSLRELSSRFQQSIMYLITEREYIFHDYGIHRSTCRFEICRKNFSYLKAAVNTVWILSKSCMFFWVFRFAKNTNFLLKGGIRFFL